MFKKYLISTISILLVLSFSFTAFAASFSDVANGYSWAEAAITEMTDKGIINGYPDGSFKPGAGITKIQAMLLISRILGYNQGAYSPYMEYITEYAGISDLGLTYEEELAFLIYKGVFKASEIIEAKDSMNEPLLRYEVAEYLTRAMGQYETAKATDSVKTGYDDEELIPEEYLPFVAYVKDANLMLGTGTTIFSPENQVTRAQMAVLLLRVMEALSLNIFETDLLGYNEEDKTLKVILSDTVGDYDATEAFFYINGALAAASEYDEGETVILVFEKGVLKRVEKITEPSYEPEEPEIDYTEEKRTVNGKINEINLADQYVSITDSADATSKRFYFTEGCKAIVDGNERTLSALRTKDHVMLSLNINDEILKATILDMSSEFSGGKIVSVSTKDGLYITIEKSNGEIVKYTTTDVVAVKRNSENVSLSEVLSGDTIARCVLNYNMISALEVRSIISSTSGSIVEIVISDDSSMVIDGRNGESRYSIGDDIKITVDGEPSDVYGLRLGMNASVTLDSNTITKITVTSVSDAGTINGRVRDVNKSYGFINVITSDGSEKQVFVNNSTYIYDDATKRTKTLSNIEVDDTLIVIGKTVNGAFQATTIILVAE